MLGLCHISFQDVSLLDTHGKLTDAVSRQAKQNWHLSLDSNFEATRNSRNAAMLHDAAEFARNLRTCEKEIQNLKAVSEGSHTLQHSHPVVFSISCCFPHAAEVQGCC